MGLKPWEFWELTWEDYHRQANGFHHRQELEWERVRWLGALTYNANSKKTKTPEQLVPLNLDKQRKLNGPKVDVKRLQEIMEEAQQQFNRKKVKNGEQ